MVPTSTVSCSPTKISDTTPSTGDGISVSTLSVLISKKVSSFLIFSPVFLYHFIMVPSITDSPIFGITTSVISPEAACPVSCCSTFFSLEDFSISFTSAFCSFGSSFFSVSFFISCFSSGFSAFTSPFDSIIATTEPTSTVSPSFAFISASKPSAGEGISVSTLSVLISKIISSLLTLSPFFLCHLIMVPSLTLSPIFGIITSILALLISVCVQLKMNN